MFKEKELDLYIYIHMLESSFNYKFKMATIELADCSLALDVSSDRPCPAAIAALNDRCRR